MVERRRFACMVYEDRCCMSRWLTFLGRFVWGIRKHFYGFDSTFLDLRSWLFGLRGLSNDVRAIDYGSVYVFKGKSGRFTGGASESRASTRAMAWHGFLFLRVLWYEMGWVIGFNIRRLISSHKILLNVGVSSIAIAAEFSIVSSLTTVMAESVHDSKAHSAEESKCSILT